MATDQYAPDTTPDDRPGPLAGPTASGGDRSGPARSRRDLLAVTGLGVVGGGLLAACGSGSTSAAPGTAVTSAAAKAAGPSSAEATTGATAEPTGSATASSEPSSAAPSAQGTASAAPAGQLTVQKSAIPVGSGTIYPKTKLVVTQPAAGSFKAFSAVCPHQGCIVATIQNRAIICPCHASQFDIASGAVLSGPSPTGLSVEQIDVTASEVVVR